MRVAHIRCFWRRPFGHRWKFLSEHGDEHLRCIDCGRRAKTGSFRPGSSGTSSSLDDGAYGGNGGE